MVRRYQIGVIRMTRASSTTTDIRATAIAAPRTAMTTIVPMVMTTSTVVGSAPGDDGTVSSTTVMATLLSTIPMPSRPPAGRASTSRCVPRGARSPCTHPAEHHQTCRITFCMLDI
jgi:hypothetical protein